ncbi:MAG: MFS transporter [Acidimicrobiia bacterium]
MPRRRSVAAWTVYDLANTIFALGVGSLYFASWLSDRDVPDIALAAAIDGAMIVVIVLGPWIGARSDHQGHRVPYLVPTTLLAVAATAFLGAGAVALNLVLFAIALIGFNLGTVIYDALLPDVSTPENRGRVSGAGVAVGYVGSFIAVGVGKLLLDSSGYPAVFRTIAVLFLLFAVPTFLFVEESPRAPRRGAPPRLRRAVGGLIEAWRRAGNDPGVRRFLVARFFYSDAINTLIGGFLTIFVLEDLEFSDAEVQNLLGVAIFGAVAGAVIVGRLVDRFGPRRLLHATLWTWMAAIAAGIVAAITGATWLAWVLGTVGGMALGATWASDRVYMVRLAPPVRLGELYGLYATVGRFATVLGPLVWGLTVTVFGLPRTVAMGVLIGFIAAALVILRGVEGLRTHHRLPASR